MSLSAEQLRRILDILDSRDVRPGPLLGALHPRVQGSLRVADRRDYDARRDVVDGLAQCAHPAAVDALRIVLARIEQEPTLADEEVAFIRAALAGLAPARPRGEEDWVALAAALAGSSWSVAIVPQRAGRKRRYVRCGRGDEWGRLQEYALRPSGAVRLVLLGADGEDHPRFRRRLADWFASEAGAPPPILVGGHAEPWSWANASAYAEDLWGTLAPGAPAPASLDELLAAAAKQLADRVAAARAGAVSGEPARRLLLVHPTFELRGSAGGQEAALVAYHRRLESALAAPGPSGAPLHDALVVLQPLAWEGRSGLFQRLLASLGRDDGPDLRAWKDGEWGARTERLGPLRTLTKGEVQAWLESSLGRSEDDALAQAAATVRGAATSRDVYDRLELKEEEERDGRTA